MNRQVFRLTALLILLPATADAQQSVSLRIDEFEGFSWGTAQEVILDSLGEPIQADTLEDNIVVLAFESAIDDTASIAMFAFFPGQGLVKGQHSILFDASIDCVALFRDMRHYLLLKYPMIVPVDRSRNDSSKGFCDAVPDGDAAWITSWEDSRTGARALVSIEAGRPRLNVVFESAEFIAWVEDAEREPDPEP
jgi:hypothetical protein